MIRIISDDLTGANDAAVQFANLGFRTLTVLDSDYTLPSTYQVVAASTGSRALPQKEARQVVASHALSLQIWHGDILFKKIDSALRGNIGVEIGALLSTLPWAKAVLVAPAFPANGRITRGGHQLINAVPVHETEMAQDPINPVTESYLPAVLGQQYGEGIGYLPIVNVLQGAEEVRSTIEAVAASGVKIIIADATSQEHLDILARAIVEDPTIIPCGSAGLASALAGVLAEREDPVRSAFSAGLDAPSSILGMVGSKSATSVQQVRRVKTELPWVKEIAVSPSRLGRCQLRGFEIERVGGLVDEVKRGQSVLLYLNQEEGTLTGGLEVLDASLICTGLGEVMFRVLKTTDVAEVFLAGGDVAAQVLERLHVRAIELIDELEPGVCAGRLVGGIVPGVQVVTKAGSFGDEDTLVRIYERQRLIYP